MLGCCCSFLFRHLPSSSSPSLYGTGDHDRDRTALQQIPDDAYVKARLTCPHAPSASRRRSGMSACNCCRRFRPKSGETRRPARLRTVEFRRDTARSDLQPLLLLLLVPLPSVVADLSPLPATRAVRLTSYVRDGGRLPRGSLRVGGCLYGEIGHHCVIGVVHDRRIVRRPTVGVDETVRTADGARHGRDRRRTRHRGGESRD